ncbi:TRAP transporter fused permease subunit [Sinirhodobacter sp. HNIBRBA609]|nr:TRAP transporter fused permease subunit [Sinirhodobacter sp. HNIBRBA609]
MRAKLVVDQFLSLELASALAFVLWRRAGVATDLAALAAYAVAGAAAVSIGLFMFQHFGGEGALFIAPSAHLLLVSAGLIALTLLCTWLASGQPMLLLLTGVLLFGFCAQFLPAPFDAAPVRADRYTVYLVFGGNGFLGRALGVIAGTVTIFILFGAAYEVSGGTAAIDALARRFSRRGRGVAIKATVVSSGLFGMVSGSATSNVLTSGAFTILGMRRLGLSAPMAGGIEAVSSTMGQITPPVMGAAAFLMADLTGMSYGRIALAAAVPAILCYALMFHQASWIARRMPRQTAPVLSAEDEALFKAQQSELSARDLWHLLPVLVIVVVMFKGDRMTELAGIAGTLAALLVGLILDGPRELWARVKRSAPGASRTVAGLVIAGSALGVVLGVLGMTGLDVSLTLGIRELGEKSVLLSLVLTAAAALVLGTGMATTGVYIVVGTLLAPGLVALGVPVVAAHMFVLYFGVVSMITPPVAFAALAASGISGASFSATAWAAMRFGWMIYVLPFVFVYVPELLLVGTFWEVAASLAGAAAAVVAVGVLLSASLRPVQIGAAVGLLLSVIATVNPTQEPAMAIGLALAGLAAALVGHLMLSDPSAKMEAE